MTLPWKSITRHATTAVLALLIVLDLVLLIKGPKPAEHHRAIQTALTAGEKPDWWDDAALGVHYGAWIGLAGWILLLLTQKWWARPWQQVRPGPQTQAPKAHARWFWPLVVLASVLCLGMRLPLASKSLWWDESWAAQQASHGKWKEDAKKPGNLKFMAHDWKRCAFYYQKPTNHVPVSLAQKASLQLWQGVTGAKRDTFNDLVARVPALLASMATVVLIACLLRTWGQPGGGVAAALILAVHPWAIRHGVDTRAYAFVIPLCVAGMYAATLIIRSQGRSPGAWISFGLVELLWLWAYPNAVFDIAALNLVTLAFLLSSQPNRADRWSAWWRLAATNAFAALILIQLFLPNLFQARRWAGLEKDKHFLNEALFNQTAANLLAGIDHTAPISLLEGAGIPQLRDHYLAAGLLVGLLLASILGVAGRTLLRERTLRLVLPLALVVSAVVFALVTRTAESYFYPRFVIAVLPCLVILGVQAVSVESFSRNGKTPGLAWAFPALMTALYLWLIWPGWTLLMTRPIEPLHEVAAFVQKDAAKDKTPPLIVCYGLGKEALPLYEPHCLPVGTSAELSGAIARATAEKRALYAIYGYNSFNRVMAPDGFRVLDDKALFSEVAAFPGIEAEFYFRVLKAVPASGQ